ncbi:MAG: peptidoglycan bridge formation glycyltransferase FemA/FemB family protein [Patescibacteria group bacterium]
MDTYNFKEINKEEYRRLTVDKNLPLTQNYFYGEWQEATGRIARYFIAKKGGETASVFLVVKYAMSFGKAYLYIPHGPILYSGVDAKFFEEFKYFLNSLTVQENSIFCRFDPYYLAVDMSEELVELNKIFYRPGRFTYSGNFQPKFEWAIDLTKTEDEIMAEMKKVNRYTVRQAKKNGVAVETIKSGFMSYFEDFYRLASETAIRDRFTEYPKEYYLNIFKNCEKNKNCFLNVVRLNGEVLLVNIFIVFGDTASWLFSGSSNKERQTGYTYLAQWRTIQEAKRMGLKYYNFGGVEPLGKTYKTYKGWAGLTDFKRRFGGFQLEYSDPYDVVANKFWYAIYLIKKFFI